MAKIQYSCIAKVIVFLISSGRNRINLCEERLKSQVSGWQEGLLELKYIFFRLTAGAYSSLPVRPRLLNPNFLNNRLVL